MVPQNAEAVVIYITPPSELTWNSNLAKSRLRNTYCSFGRSLWNFAQSTAVVLSCSVQNFKTTRQLHWMLWINEILRDLIPTWVSEGCLILQQPRAPIRTPLRPPIVMLRSCWHTDGTMHYIMDNSQPQSLMGPFIHDLVYPEQYNNGLGCHIRIGKRTVQQIWWPVQLIYWEPGDACLCYSTGSLLVLVVIKKMHLKTSSEKEFDHFFSLQYGNSVRVLKELLNQLVTYICILSQILHFATTKSKSSKGYLGVSPLMYGNTLPLLLSWINFNSSMD